MTSKSITILAADDDLEDLELIEDAFSSLDQDISLYKVTNGKAVIDYLNNLPDSDLPCLIILDYNMPELKGSEVLAKIGKEKRYAEIPKLMLSTSSAPLHIHECISNGAAEYYVKPTSMRELEVIAKKMLAFCKLN
ncbi:MAG TPA: response regulator [Flavitalea sp.]|nr:response regulator [Flavitalea sp.]